jgi:antitoxin (DNA-binding transcriptional repressor) of toxin-antitoxin stability system
MNMTMIALEQTQTTLSELIHRLTPGEEVIILENDRAVARLVRNPLPPGKQSELVGSWPCNAGSAKGTIHWMAPDFDAPLDEFKEYME